ncbi:MAG: DUF3530 family protein [Spongiibacteraceae bacterium]
MTLLSASKIYFVRNPGKLLGLCFWALAASLPAAPTALAQAQAAVTTQTNGDTEPPADTNPHQSAMDKTVPEVQQAWLNAAGKPSLAFYLAESSGKAHGGVILIPGLNQHPATQGLINTLRHTLSQNHWHTLALNMTDLDAAQSQAVITAGVAFLNQQGVNNIAILGEGAGADMAINYAATVSKSNNHQLRAVVLINASNELQGDKSQPTELLATLKIPVFDTFLSGDNLQQQRANQRRRAVPTGNKQYQQARLPQVNNYSVLEENHVTKRLRGWLDNNAANL